MSIKKPQFYIKLVNFVKNICGDRVFNSKQILKELKNINEKLDKYFELQNDKKKQLFESFVWGISRGLGISVGIVILGTILILILRELVTLPVIGEYIAQIIEMVDVYLKK